jgi:hypothetical protein
LHSTSPDFSNAPLYGHGLETPTGVAEVPLTDIAVEAFRSQIELVGPEPWSFS